MPTGSAMTPDRLPHHQPVRRPEPCSRDRELPRLHALVQGITRSPTRPLSRQGGPPRGSSASNPESLQPFMADDRLRLVSADPPDQVWTDGYSDNDVAL